MKSFGAPGSDQSRDREGAFINSWQGHNDAALKNKKGDRPQMNTDEHRLNTKCLSVFIRVHLWPNCLFQQPASNVFSAPSRLRVHLALEVSR